MTDRYAPFRALARDLSVDALILVPGANFVRLLGKDFLSHERPMMVVIPVEGAPMALVPNLELASFDLVGFEGEVIDWRDQDGYRDAFVALARAMPLRSVGVEGQIMRVFVHHALAEAWPGLRIVDAEGAISGLRLRKTSAEITAMEEAIRISEAALGEVLDAVRPGMTEKEVERRLVLALFSQGAEEQAFGALVAAGENSALPHATARADHPIAAGEALLLDFGARWGGLCADVTRTVFVGHVTDEAAEVYDVVLRANLRGLEVAGPGVTAHEVDDAVIGVLEASRFADRIRAKTGHGLGREVHEAPYIMRGNHQALEPGMVFTCEPGLYRTGGFGVRIEDDVLVTADGCRTLTTFPKDLRVVGGC